MWVQFVAGSRDGQVLNVPTPLPEKLELPAEIGGEPACAYLLKQVMLDPRAIGTEHADRVPIYYAAGSRPGGEPLMPGP